MAALFYSKLLFARPAVKVSSPASASSATVTAGTARLSAGNARAANGITARARIATEFGQPNRTISNVICVLNRRNGVTLVLEP